MSTTIATVEVEAEAPIHGHEGSPCVNCWNPETCDCPCTSCIHYRHSAAGSDCTCGCMGPTDYDYDDASSCGTNDRPEDNYYDDEFQEMAYADDDDDGAPEERYEDTGEYWN